MGQYIECLIPNCDGVAGKERCQKCGSGEVEPFVMMGVPDGATHCRPCGHVMWSGCSVEQDEG